MDYKTTWYCTEIYNCAMFQKHKRRLLLSPWEEMTAGTQNRESGQRGFGTIPLKLQDKGRLKPVAT
jgi:hypothetical protein